MRPYALSANLALGLFTCFSVLLIAMHALRPDYTPVDHMISDYAVGRFGWVMTIAFVSVGLGCLALAIALWQWGPKAILARVGSALMAVACLGLMVTATFATDLETAPETSHGDIHAISFLVNVFSLLIAAFATSISFGKAMAWRPLRPLFIGLSVPLLAAFVTQALTLHKGAPYGWTNRLFVVVLLVWLFSAAWQLRQAASRSTIVVPA